MSQEIDNEISDNNSEEDGYIRPIDEIYTDKLIDDEENSFEEEEYIRPIDEIYTDKLIDNEENSFEEDEEDDEEFKLALNVSKNDYYDNEYNNVLDNVFKISLDEYNENIKKGRKESLSLFLKKIEKLSYTKEDIEIKTYIMDTLNSYFNLIIEFVYIEEELYQKIYKIIDSYYLIPIEKGNKKTAITKEEDLIIRSIFLEK